MSKHEIPKDQWMSFFNTFNQANKNKIVKIEITDDEDYRVDYAESLPFREITIDSKDGRSPMVSVSAGASASFKHRIEDAAIVILEEIDNRPKVLQVRSSLGRSAIIRFHPVGEDESVI